MTVNPQRILWPTDFSPLSLHGARYARGFCELFNADLHVIHVLQPPITADVSVMLPTDVPVACTDREHEEACRDSLDRVIKDNFPAIGSITQQLCVGNPWSSICDYAREHDVDLVVVTTHGRTGLPHVLLGSTAERIVQHAPCPVLVIKNPEKDFVDEG